MNDLIWCFLYLNSNPSENIFLPLLTTKFNDPHSLFLRDFIVSHREWCGEYRYQWISVDVQRQSRRNTDYFSTFSLRSATDPAHIELDIAVEMGILRCSDIEGMNVISIVREPMARIISYCNWLANSKLPTGVYNMSSMIPKLRSASQASYFQFEYDWNVTVFTMESMDQITSWFAEYGVEVLFDEDHRTHQTAGKVDKCHVDDLNEEDRLFLEEWLITDTRLYEAVRDNGGSMRIEHHNHWIRD